jgi:hypothetical protein
MQPFRLAADLQRAASSPPQRQDIASHTDGTKEADMNPITSAELTRYRIADLHRAAQRAQLAQPGGLPWAATPSSAPNTR